MDVQVAAAKHRMENARKEVTSAKESVEKVTLNKTRLSDKEDYVRITNKGGYLFFEFIRAVEDEEKFTMHTIKSFKSKMVVDGNERWSLWIEGFFNSGEKYVVELRTKMIGTTSPKQ
jgi:hypothetical protein